MSDRIYTLVIDDQLDLKLKQLQESMQMGEQIVSTTTAGNKLVITTRVEGASKPKNLLLEQIGNGEMPAEVLGLKDK
jgi:hypothetical protein